MMGEVGCWKSGGVALGRADEEMNFKLFNGDGDGKIAGGENEAVGACFAGIRHEGIVGTMGELERTKPWVEREGFWFIMEREACAVQFGEEPWRGTGLERDWRGR